MRTGGASIEEVDYLVIGAGAGGMAFTDALVTESNFTAVVVERRPAPGGHWNDAYPFVRLHQPSAYYGCNSRLRSARTGSIKSGKTGACTRSPVRPKSAAITTMS